MDPNETLRHMIERAREIEARADERDARATGGAALNEEQADNAEHLAALVLALDGWLKKGGFLPRQWERA